jgi:hypothetical protein
MDKRIAELGFVDVYDVSGRYSISDLVPKSKKRCGIYLLEFSDGLCYIGQAVDVVRRFSQHRNRYDNIIRFYFQPVRKLDLDAIERSTCYAAPEQEITLVNRDHVSGVVGDADFDVILSPDEQLEWLEDTTRHQDRTFRIEDKAQRVSHHHQFASFKSHRYAERIVTILRHYIRETIPAYRKTERTFWSLSCLPATNKSTWPRFSCCSINTMETFVIGHLKQDSLIPWAFIIVADTVFSEKFPDDDFFYKKYPGTEITLSNYKAAGPDQILISMTGFEQIEAVIQDDDVLLAASVLNLDVMRKGATVQWRGHCFDLADWIV